MPMCIVDSKGKIISANEHISDVFIYDGIIGSDFFGLTGINMEALCHKQGKEAYFTIDRNKKTFRIIVSCEGEEEDGNILVFFYDITNFQNLKDIYNDEKICIALINIDNYDELIANTAADRRMSISTAIDKTIRHWASKRNGSLHKISDVAYIMYFHYQYLESITEGKFAILDEVKQIETETDFPMSLSIGVGVGGKTLALTEEYAKTALDLALGRGGDQAVVKRISKIEYYGGRMQTVEKSNKGKSRVVAHALKQLIEQSDRVLIMGHKNTDMDAFGSSLGIYRICQMSDTEAFIVIDEISDSLYAIYKQARESDNYNFVSSSKALTMVQKDTLLVILDTHRPSYVQSRELEEAVDKVVIIDHHRRAEDCIEKATLSYIESYASSTAELVTEIIQYAGFKKKMIKLEAEALLAGITIDTNRFAVKTGVRTFEAAAWLRRSGADTTEVKRFFQTDMEDFRVRAKCIASAHYYESGIATSILDGENQDAQVINAQVADELLNIKGVKASFVAGRNEHGKTVVSARSLGALNVQLIMEKLGGGGHLTTAGAQVDMSPEETIEKIIEILRKK
jgi:Predicted signaling protein consisting of a modified GGDEF domain and a DHH domain